MPAEILPPANAELFSHPIPVFRVASVAASVDYYLVKLGFKLNFEYGHAFASVSRGHCTLFLTEGDQGHAGTWIWIGIEDVDTMHAQLLEAGAIVRHPPTEYEWGREMQVADPDGNILRISSDPTPGAPRGEWLDMYGGRWIRNPDGTVSKVAS